MKISEVEKRTGLKREAIRYYEDEGLLNTKRNKNGYRDYSEDNIVILNKIIMLRKIGMRIDDIRKLINKEYTLQELLPENRNRLMREAKEIEGALRFCDYLQKEKISFQDMNIDNLQRVMLDMENNGFTFAEILETSKDFLKKEIQDRGIYYGLGSFKLIHDKLWMNILIPVITILICAVFLSIQMHNLSQFHSILFSILRIVFLGSIYLIAEALVNVFYTFILKRNENIHIIRVIAIIITVIIIAILHGVFGS